VRWGKSPIGRIRHIGPIRPNTVSRCISSTEPLGDQEDLNVFAHNSLATMPVGLQTESSGHVTNTQSYKNTIGAGVTSASTLAP